MQHNSKEIALKTLFKGGITDAKKLARQTGVSLVTDYRYIEKIKNQESVGHRSCFGRSLTLTTNNLRAIDSTVQSNLFTKSIELIEKYE